MHRLLSTPQGASPITAAALAVSAAGVLIHRSNTASASTAPCIHLASTKVDGSCEMPTLVLVHGLDSTRFTWNPFMERNAGRYKMIAVDLRGHGESALGDESHFTAEAVAADIRHTLRLGLRCDVGKWAVQGGEGGAASGVARPFDGRAGATALMLLG
eukprot:TRINITY_DN11815_c0_g1_i1.p2 TRINITY_DN11815_c0_g1~~TRINITY_DN11815_c0_g1_i1.p2  ORF type:complete len:158 (-),score=26.32 TRINITY_DN11815_c0_g1_i1:364-837(-)